MTIADMRKRIEEIDEEIENQSCMISVYNISVALRASKEKKIRRLEAEKANLEQDIEDRIFENELEAFETLKRMPEGSDD